MNDPITLFNAALDELDKVWETDKIKASQLGWQMLRTLVKRFGGLESYNNITAQAERAEQAQHET